MSPLEQGSPTPRPWTSTGPRPVRNWAAQQEVSGNRVREASSATPHRSPLLPLPPEPPPPATPLSPSVEKLFSMKLVPGAKMLETTTEYRLNTKIWCIVRSLGKQCLQSYGLNSSQSSPRARRCSVSDQKT